MAGFSVLRDRFLPVLLHVVLKKVLAGALWWVICGIAVVLLLLVLSLVELINSNAVGPVFVALVSFFPGFFLFAVFDFLRSLSQFFRSTRSRQEREELFLRLNACDHAQKLALLRLTSASLARKVPGDSLLEALLMGLLLAGTAIVLIVLLVLLSGIFPALGTFPQLLLVAAASFFLGLLGPGMVQHRFFLHHVH